MQSPVVLPELKPTKLLALTSLLVLVLILTLGLWPFHSPSNEVYWSRDGGLTFGKHGSVLSDGVFPAVTSKSPLGCSVEIWLRPASIDESHTVLAFYDSARPAQASMRQQLMDLVLQSSTVKAWNAYAGSSLLIPGALKQDRWSFVTISSGPSGTSVYIDGRLARSSRRFTLTARNCDGRLVVANSPTENDSWSGTLKGLSVFDGTLSSQQVQQSYRDWIQHNRPLASAAAQCVAAYVFGEGAGRRISNEVHEGKPLYIPYRYFVLDHRMLTPPWQEFQYGPSYWMDVVKNIVGFVPLGFVFCAYLDALHAKNAGVLTIVIGAAVSVTIEVLQAFLPTRDSGMTDVITNTLGTAIGVLLVRHEPCQKMLRWVWAVAAQR